MCLMNEALLNPTKSAFSLFDQFYSLQSIYLSHTYTKKKLIGLEF